MLSTFPLPTGFDASILHLQQIWNNARDPFCGVLGIGQGAVLASILPLFRKRTDHENNHGLEDDIPTPMFPGLNFLVLLHYRNELCIHSSSLDNWIDFSCSYSTSSEIFSRLHIYREGDMDGRTLYEACLEATAHRDYQTNEAFAIPNDSDVSTVNMSTMNAIGRFLVQQKNRVKSLARDAATLFDESPELNTVRMIRQRISNLEAQAISLINESIALDPPKSLMAVITKHRSSDGSDTETLFGGWTGHKDAFRNEEFKQAGGAPCPSIFKIPRSQR